MAIIREIYEAENPVLEKLKEMDSDRAERVIAAYYEKQKIKKPSPQQKRLSKIEI